MNFLNFQLFLEKEKVKGTLINAENKKKPKTKFH